MFLGFFGLQYVLFYSVLIHNYAADMNTVKWDKNKINEARQEYTIIQKFGVSKNIFKIKFKRSLFSVTLWNHNSHYSGL